MKLNDFLIEAQTEEGQKLEQALAEAMKKVFSNAYLGKVKDRIGDDIIIKKKDFGNKAVAYTKGRTIFVNKPIFEKMKMKDKVRYLLHELIHVMQNTTNKIVIRSFKEIYDLADELWPIVKKNLQGKLPVFLTGRNQNLGTADKYLKFEMIAYLMNNDIRWDLLKKEGYEKFVQTLRKSNLFNLNSDFWIKRLKK